jgi:hypothetical protein
MSQAPHIARIDWDDDTYWFASLDGNEYLEVRSPIVDEQELRAKLNPEGDGFRPLSFMRGWLEMQRHAPGRTVTFNDQ